MTYPSALAPYAAPGAASSAASGAGFGMPTALHLVVLALLILGAAMWIGGMVAVTMLSVVSRRILEPASRTALFRAFGRVYFPVFGIAGCVAAAAGLVLLIERGWDGLATAIVIVVAVLVVALLVGVVQARAMGRLRARAAELRAASPAGDPADADLAAVERAMTLGARRAALLRAGLGLLTAALFVLALCTAA